VSGYTALARGGLAGRLRYTVEDPVQERYLMSPGAAWILFDMLRHPFPGQAILHMVQQRSCHAWKTGTSYGFRDAWALAVTRSHTIGVWIGRPDGSPSPGQYGAATAAPLLQYVIEMLDLPPTPPPRPKTVSERSICWPTGWTREQCQARGLACQQKRTAWLLDNQAPPTLPDPHVALSGVVQTIMVNPATGKRVDSRCSVAEAAPLSLALWPQSLDPWLPAKWRRSRVIPPPDNACSHMPAAAATDMQISGIITESVLAATSDAQAPPAILLETLGGIGSKTWYLNGRPVAVTRDGETPSHRLPGPGRFQLAVVDEVGHTDLVTFEVMTATGR
jgi:penicillin-binding protein 1C